MRNRRKYHSLAPGNPIFHTIKQAMLAYLDGMPSAAAALPEPAAPPAPAVPLAVAAPIFVNSRRRSGVFV